MKQSVLALGLLAASPAFCGVADLQFFGDVYMPERVIRQTQSTADEPVVFADVKGLLKSSRHNIVNLEGPITSAFVTPELKRFLLRMPFTVPEILRTAGIGVVTLANNHSMDYGYQGIFDTQVALNAAGIAYTGAGRNREEATRPVILSGSGRSYCLLAYSRTLPMSFWAKDEAPGTASATYDELEKDVTACADSNLFTIVIFHWGQEMTNQIAPYQRELAHRAIKAGARLVLGHHPHMLQDIEIYNGRPILYSLGNFAFGSLPDNSGQEGMAVRVSRGLIELVPLLVQNAKVHFKPRPLRAGEVDPIQAHLPVINPCRWQKEAKLWSCPLEEPALSRK